MPLPWPRFRKRSKTLLLAAMLTLGTVALLAVSDPFYPISKWILWHYLAIIAMASFAMAAAWSLGDWILRVVFRVFLPTHERLAIASALGLVGFELGMFLLGVVDGYGSLSFFLFPSALLLLNVTQWRNYLRRFARLKIQGQRLTLRELSFVLFGCLTIGLIYFAILTPHNVQFDARWKHMSLAEDFVAHGGIRRMPEGWVFSARPHLTSYLFVWAFSLPFGSLFHRMELCAHLEFLAFLATTLFGIPALVRRLVPNADPRVTWVARFLFPGVLLYDSSLSGGADHFGALLAPAIALATLHAYPTLERRWVLLLTGLMAAAIMTKETVAIMLVPVPAATVGLRALWLATRAPDRKHAALRHAVTLAWAIALGAVASAPFWLKNLIYYGNPVYPSLSHVFHSRPWSDVAAYRIGVEYAETNMWAPRPTFGGFLESLRALVTFSFVPHDWSKFHGDRPVFGSLLTLLLPVALWLKHTRRAWALIGWIHVAVFTWYWVHHQDRYLQAIAPIIAACTAALLILSYRQLSRTVRTLIGLLVLVQLALGADVYFIATHAMCGSPVKKTVEMLGLGHQGKFYERFSVEPRNVALARAIPSGARVLMHDIHTHLGIEHEAVRDIALWQGGLDYSTAKSPADVHRWLSDMGINYIVANPTKSTGSDRLSSDLIFQDFLHRHTRHVRDVEGVQIFELPTTPIPGDFLDRVIVVSCNPRPEYALHRLEDLAQPGFGSESRPRISPEATSRDSSVLGDWYEEADFVVVTTKCEAPSGISSRYKKTVERNRRGAIPAGILYIRRPGA